MRYDTPTLSITEFARILITGSGGTNKQHANCPDGGADKSSGAYEIDE